MWQNVCLVKSELVWSYSSCRCSCQHNLSQNYTGVIVIYTSKLYIYDLLKLIKPTKDSSNSSCSTVINTEVSRSTNAQDLTELSNRLIVENLQRHVGLGFQPLQTKRQESGHPFLSFIWPVASSWDDHSFFKLTRDGKRALSQPAALCNLKSTGFAL